MSELSTNFAEALRQALQDRHLTVTAAAKALQVSRQAFYAYLKGKAMPRQRVLIRAAELWNIEIRFGKQVFSKEDFSSKAPSQAAPIPKQLNLWEQLDAINQEDLRIAVKRVGKELRISAAIPIPA